MTPERALGQALNDTVGRFGWLRSDDASPAEEWLENARVVIGALPSDAAVVTTDGLVAELWKHFLVRVENEREFYCKCGWSYMARPYSVELCGRSDEFMAHFARAIVAAARERVLEEMG